MPDSFVAEQARPVTPVLPVPGLQDVYPWNDLRLLPGRATAPQRNMRGWPDNSRGVPVG